MPDSSRGITCRITPAITIPYDYYTDVQPDYNTASASAYPYGYYTAFSRTITLRALVVPSWLIPRSKLPRSSLLSWAITTVQSMEFSVRPRAMRWQSIRSTTSWM